ncbi:bactofilin [Cohnella suwonensis]|uniref:Bactofilin n=1 Tax=Cohnella suwonensis TaxID=696072 RepID=A0ABW0LVT4_9BACL
MSEQTRRDLKMVGETTSAGGMFRNVRLVGESVMDGDVDCLKMGVTGELEVKGSLKAEELKATGECEIGGKLVAATVRGRGELKIGGSILSEHIKYTGNIQAGGDCEAGVLELEGAFAVAGLVSGEKVDVKLFGPCVAKEVGGASVKIKRSGASKLVNMFRPGNASLKAEQIEGDTLELEHTKASVVRGQRVTIGPGCEIGLVEYKDSLTVHKSSVVKESFKR